MTYLFFFFFKQKTAYEIRISDWSSDVCSSDLTVARPATRLSPRRNSPAPVMLCWRPRPRSTTRYGHPRRQPKDGRMAHTVELYMFFSSAAAKGVAESDFTGPAAPRRGPGSSRL